MSLDALFPVAGDHAIQNLSCVLEWKEPLTEKDVNELRGRIQQRLQAFKVFKPHHAVLVDITGTEPSANVRPTAMAGFAAQTAPVIGAAPHRHIQVVPEEIVMLFNDYSRWAAIKQDLSSYVKVIVGAVGQSSRGLKGLAIQYTDAFHWKSDPNALDIAELFSSAAPFLSPIILKLDRGTQWHCNQGFFGPSRWDAALQQLTNVNVQRSRDSGMDTITIVTVHRIQFPQPKWDNAEAKCAIIDEIYECFHQDNKNLLASLLSPEVCEKINLKP
jgi:hypothetical protein